MQSSMSTTLKRVSTNTFSRPSICASSILAVPVARPGPWTDAGLTHTTSRPCVAPISRTARSPACFVRS